jgi:group II intron reverse transcriptase/maturase
MATKVQNKNQTRKINKLRYVEYYNQQPLLDGLYVASADGKLFNNLMPLILSENNILLAYRSIKNNIGSMTPGTDNLNIKDIEVLEPEELVNGVRKKLENYQPKAVKRKEIPKPNGKTRPLGIPCIWDRLIQQCILQILEPICEAKFSDNSYGFRPLRSAENAIAAEMRHINHSKLRYVVEVDIKSFFDEVNHTKLMRQLWSIGIRDKKLLAIIKAILKAPIRMPDNTVIHPKKGTPQGGILSPLLANVVLNELDQWIDSQWEENPVVYTQKMQYNSKGVEHKGNGYKAMRKTNLKEIHIVRYADDVRILCRTRSQADKTMIAVKQWLSDRLKLQVSEEKTRVVNLKR